MESWWEGLTALNKGFLAAAAFFSILFLWQLLSALVGLGMDGHADAGDASVDHGDFHADTGAGDGTFDHDHPGESDHGHELGGDVTFSLVSVRSVLAFGMLFSWAGSLYIMGGTPVLLALAYSLVWGLIAMFLTAFLIYKLLRMQETGTASLWSALGEEGVVYIRIPEEGTGQIRVLVSGSISFVKAGSRAREPLDAGTRVRVVGVVDDNTVEVEPTEIPKG